MKDYCIDNLKYQDFLEQNNLETLDKFFSVFHYYSGTNFNRLNYLQQDIITILKNIIYDDVKMRYKRTRILYTGDEILDEFMEDFSHIIEKNINSWVMQAKYIYDLLLKLDAEKLTLDESRNSTYDMDIKSKYKEAQTPTLVLENTDDFLDKYTNLKNNLEKSDDRTTTSEVHKGYLQELENVNKLYVSLTSQIIASFSPLFVQVIY